MTPTTPASRHVVVDGSNIATEGRSTPSLAQLQDAVAELRKENPDAEVTVVVDATFAHRIDQSERDAFEAAVLRGELVSPPAGAIGRGDAFLLRIAEKVDGVVLSNDSFQEFHGEHPWLFDRGRLLGASPVPGIGWIFVPRSPVRGPKSRVATRDAGRERQRVQKAIAEATEEVEHPDVAPPASRRESRPSASGTPQAVNGPTPFITFIADHPLGSLVEGEVEGFASHGAVIRYGDTLCYVPLSGLANPAPKSAREVLKRGERRTFVVTALDPYRRGIELALPEVAVVSGQPKEETVAAEVKMAGRGARRKPADPATTTSGAPASGRRRTRTGSAPAEVEAAVDGAVAAPRRRTRAPKAEATPTPTQATPSEVPAEAELPPAPRRRRTAASTDALPAPASAASSAPAPAARSRSRRPKSAAVDAVPENPPAASAPPASAPVRPRTRAVKASAAKAEAPTPPKRTRRAPSPPPAPDSPSAAADATPAPSPRRRSPRPRSTAGSG